MLEIKNLHATVAGKEILRGVDLNVNAGEVHAIMGPNGSGKSTLANVLAGREIYEVTEGSVTYEGKNLLDMAPEVRACEGVFLAFQYPVEIPGVNNTYFLRTAYNAIQKYRSAPELDEALMNRSVNEGFSGGEKKRNEILQMAVLDPKLAVLDETDSGLDIDALRVVAEGVNRLKSEKHAVIVITHYQRLLNYLIPDFVHVMSEGRLVRSGGRELAEELEQKGYTWLEEDLATVNG